MNPEFLKAPLMLSYLNTLPFLQGLSKSTWLIHGHPLKRSSKSWRVQDDHPPTEMSPGISVSFVHFATGSASNEVFKRPFRRWSSWTLPTQVGSDQVTKRGNHPEYEAWGLWPKKKTLPRIQKFLGEDEASEVEIRRWSHRTPWIFCCWKKVLLVIAVFLLKDLQDLFGQKSDGFLFRKKRDAFPKFQLADRTVIIESIVHDLFLISIYFWLQNSTYKRQPSNMSLIKLKQASTKVGCYLITIKKNNNRDFQLGGGFKCFCLHPDPCKDDPIWRTSFFKLGWNSHFA